MRFKAVLWNESGAYVTEFEPLPLRPRDALVRVVGDRSVLGASVVPAG